VFSKSKTVLTPLKRDVGITPERRHRSAYAADCDVIACYDGAKLTEKHLAAVKSIRFSDLKASIMRWSGSGRSRRDGY
jgi:hypothetical protein